MTTPRLTEDDRYALASRADAGARANRPAHLPALGAVALLIALIVLAFAWRADASAGKKLRNKAAELVQIRQRADRLATLQTQLTSSPDEDRNRKLPDINSRFENLAREAGLENMPGVPNTENRAYEGARQVNYQFLSRNRTQLRDPSLEHLINWVDLVTTRVPGMYIQTLSITPQANGWSMEVVFSRFERLD